MKKSIFAFLIIFTFVPFSLALASIEINEIMYDLSGSDEGREWIEVFNNSSEEVDIAPFVLFEAAVNHKLVLKSESSKVPAYGYAVIVSNDIKWRSDWPNFSGIVFDSSFSLSNSGESLVIKNEEKVESEYTYSSVIGADGNGETLQKVNGVWASSLPTPGRENKIEVKVQKPAPVVAKSSPVASNTTTAEGILTDSLEVTPKLELEPKVTETFSEGMSEPDEASYLPFLVLPLFVGGMALGAYFLRKSGRKVVAGDDFEILED